MDKTYAETQGVAAVDWPRVIMQFPAMAEEEHAHFYKLSMEWPTCACGSQCAIIPRHTRISAKFRPGAPIDVQLQRLGAEFPSYVRRRDVERALDCWGRIEARSAVLIRDELAKLSAHSSETNLT